MKPRFSRKQRARRSRTTRGQGGLQSLGSPYNYRVSTGPVRAPPLPKEFSVSLSDYTTLISSAATDQQQLTYGLVEFLNKRPLFSVEFYTIYKWCRVTAVDVRVELTNVGASSIQLAVGHIPYEDVASITLSKLTQMPDSTRKTISAKGGLDRAVISKSFNVQQIIGNPSFDQTFWINATQSVSSTPVSVRAPVICLVMDNAAGGTVEFSYDLIVKTTYHLQWFDIETPSES